MLTLTKVRYYNCLAENPERLTALSEAKDILTDTEYTQLLDFLIQGNLVLSKVIIIDKVSELFSYLPLACNWPTKTLLGDFKNLDTDITKPFIVLFQTCRVGYYNLLIWNPQPTNIDEELGKINSIDEQI